MIAAETVKDRMNVWGDSGTPFLFGVDYEMQNGFCIANPMNQQDILWRVGNVSNHKTLTHRLCDKGCPVTGRYFEKHPIGINDYRRRFDHVRGELLIGNSFLANLTIRTPIDTDYSFEEIFERSNSPYALLLPNRLVCFSPETFIRIADGRISSNPMKGTISASVPGAEEVILADHKESAEHHTIVDLIRNDLSRVATDVVVEKLRYIERLHTSGGDILQVSSLISGAVACRSLGDILFEMLPAGSVSGAPKPSTLRILAQAEGCARGYYCGVFGYFDGHTLDSAVMIRYIERSNDGLIFRSGGGITVNSSCESEYQECIDKIYLPFV